MLLYRHSFGMEAKGKIIALFSCITLIDDLIILEILAIVNTFLKGDEIFCTRSMQK